MAEVVLAYEMPLVSGKDSMKNDFVGQNKGGDRVQISVEPTLLITALAAHPDVSRVVRSAARASDYVYLIGVANFEKSFDPKQAPDISKWNLKETLEVYKRYFQATQKGLIRFGHDVSDGGLLVALAETLFLNHCGIEIDTKAGLLRAHESENSLFFSEHPGLLVVGTTEENRTTFESMWRPNQIRFLGRTNSDGVIAIKSDERNISVDIETLRMAWGAGP
jgi:phosphoribosylformylglycinamidine synthase